MYQLIAIFCFYNISSGIQAKLSFSDTFKHCNIITYDGCIWLATEFDHTGIHTQKINARSGAALLRGMKCIQSLTAMVVVSIAQRATITWKPYLVRSCNELDRYISGVDVGFTFNPKHLYNKLIKYDHTNYDILYRWVR